MGLKNTSACLTDKTTLVAIDCRISGEVPGAIPLKGTDFIEILRKSNISILCEVDA
jgi:hypothetical protein